MINVALLVFPGVQALDIAGPLDVLAEANRFVAADSGYRISTLASRPGPLRASNGMPLGADQVIGETAQGFDLLLVPGGPDLPQAPRDEALSAWLQREAALAPRFGSICTGAFLLGHAGLLDGRQVTTHWSDAQHLQACFPLAQVEEDRIYVQDGALITSAGVTAGMDLALALVADDHGPAVALKVAKRLLLVARRQGGQSQFSPFLTEAAADDSAVAQAQRHVMQHLAEPLSVEALAELVAMSPRHFARIFTREAGLPPAEFVQRARIDRARQLLEGTALPFKTVAWRCGFGSAARMRLVFGQRLGVTPTQYREQFGRPT